MTSIYVLPFLIASCLSIASTTETCSPPNIVLIVADDLGWDDVSFHGSDQIMTPNIDLLAYSGVALGRYYSHSVCTPSRSALLTGKYAHVTGMQGYPLLNGEDRGLPVNVTILPQYLKELGYSTHLVGKWHLGKSRQEFLPTFRGFDSHFGHRGGFVDYYEYVIEEQAATTGYVSGLDLFRNLTPAWEDEGYITDLYTDEAKTIIMDHDESAPLFLMLGHNAPHCANAGALVQAPPEDVRAMRHIESPQRKIFAAMVKKLDDSVGDVVEALLEKGILNNTVIVFISDNGGITSGLTVNYASNWPMRGIKRSPFEGGVRVAGLLWSPTLNNSNHLWKGYIHVTDWLPTLLAAAGSEAPSDIDGINLWDKINSCEDSDREEIFEIDDYTGFASIISGDYKLVTGTVLQSHSTYQGGDLRGIIGNGTSYTDAIANSKMYTVLECIGKPFDIDDINLRTEIRLNCTSDGSNICYPKNGTSCLYNIKEDPCETTDLFAELPDLVANLTVRLEVEMTRVIPRTVPLVLDARAAPALHNYTWDTWADDESS